MHRSASDVLSRSSHANRRDQHDDVDYFCVHGEVRFAEPADINGLFSFNIGIGKKE